MLREHLNGTGCSIIDRDMARNKPAPGTVIIKDKHGLAGFGTVILIKKSEPECLF